MLLNLCLIEGNFIFWSCEIGIWFSWFFAHIDHWCMQFTLIIRCFHFFPCSKRELVLVWTPQWIMEAYFASAVILIWVVVVIAMTKRKKQEWWKGKIEMCVCVCLMAALMMDSAMSLNFLNLMECGCVWTWNLMKRMDMMVEISWRFSGQQMGMELEVYDSDLLRENGSVWEKGRHLGLKWTRISLWKWRSPQEWKLDSIQNLREWKLKIYYQNSDYYNGSLTNL